MRGIKGIIADLSILLAFSRLGTRAPGDPTYDLHQGDYAPSEQAIGIGIRVMAATALRAVRFELAKAAKAANPIRDEAR